MMPLHVRVQNVRRVGDRVVLDLVCHGNQPAGGRAAPTDGSAVTYWCDGFHVLSGDAAYCFAEADKRGYRVHGREQAEILVERA